MNPALNSRPIGIPILSPTFSVELALLTWCYYGAASNAETPTT